MVLVIDHVIVKMADAEKQLHNLLFAFFLYSTCFLQLSCSKYQPNWASLDSRPLPSWYDESKIGIFIHWGVFAVPSVRSEWFWNDWINAKDADVVKFMTDNYKPYFTYADFAKEFTAEFYDPDEWAEIFNASGARYTICAKSVNLQDF